MKRTIRLTLVACVSMLALSFSASAFAAYSPKLTVRNAPRTGQGDPTIDIRVPQTDDPTARVQIYVPNGYTLAASTPGTKIGNVTATAQAGPELGGAVLPLTGELDVVAPSQFATQQAQCGVAAVAYTYDLHLTAAGQTLDIPVFVQATAGAETNVGQYKLVVCLPPPDVPVGTPGRATFGAKLLTAVFDVTTLTNPAATGEYRWRATLTPYTPNTGKANAAGTVEVQSLVRLPTEVLLKAAKKRIVTKKRVKGKLRRFVSTRVGVAAGVGEGDAGIQGAKVTFLVNGRKVGTFTTSAKGITAIVFTLKKGTASVSASAVVPDRDLGASACTATFGLPCTSATVGGSTVGARAVKVVAYKK
jgi:hypothetical protein